MSNNMGVPVQAETETPNFLDNIVEFLRPKIIEERRDTILRLFVSWVSEELKIYGKLSGTDQVQASLDLSKMQVKINAQGVPQKFYGFRVLMTLNGPEPHHPCSEVDCFFPIVSREDETINNLILSAANPEDKASISVQ